MKHRDETPSRGVSASLPGIKPLALLCALGVSAWGVAPPSPPPKEALPISAEPTLDDFNSTAISVEEISQRLLTLIENIRSRQDLSPATLERHMRQKVEVDPDNKNSFEVRGKLAEGGRYTLSSMSLWPDKTPRFLLFQFGPISPNEDMSPNCVPFEAFSASLIAAGCANLHIHDGYWREVLRKATA